MSSVELLDAVKSGEVKTVKDLLEAGADVNQQDKHGWTPLNWAAGKGNGELVVLLLQHGADVFKVGRDQRTPQKIALAAGHVEVVKILRQAESQIQGKADSPARKYCKAYQLSDFRQFPKWKEMNAAAEAKQQKTASKEGKNEAYGDNDIAFLHEDHVVTKSIWRAENVIFDQVTPEWKDFCDKVLRFRVPDDLDLVGARSA